MDTPCFDKKTHTDCPRRHSGCAVNCPDLAKYVAERDKEYERRATVNNQNSMFFELLSGRVAKKLRRAIENRTTGFPD